MTVMTAPFAPVTISELPPSTRFSLRTADPAAVSAGLGLELSSKIGVRAAADGRTALCLGPGEWLIEAPETQTPALTATFSGLEARLPLSAVEVSDREITLALSGPAVLDLKLAVGSGCRTLFDTVQVVLTREAEDRLHLTVWRSFAPHIRALLDIAARELAAGL